MNFFDSIKSCFVRYTDFSGRSIRSEYWNYTVFIVVLNTLTDYLDSKIQGVSFLESDLIGTLSILLIIITFIPSLSVSVRRLHDVNKSGWWLLLIFTVIGIIPLIYWACKKSDDSDNKFGSKHSS